jgi:hypothetical protein
MKDRSTFATINDFFHAALVCAVLVISTAGLFSELFRFRGEEALTLAVSAATRASMAYGATLTQPWRAVL